MKLGEIVVLLRLTQPDFENRITGAVELELAFKHTLKAPQQAFVIPLAEAASLNQYDVGMVQKDTERFGVVVAIRNDTSNAEKTGIIAFDQLHGIRTKLIKVLVGLDLGYETPVRYRGGRLIDINNGYLWWQYEFEYDVTIQTDTDGFGEIVQVDVADRQQRSQLPDFSTIYANIILSPSADLPYDGDLPLDDSYPDVTVPDMGLWIDLTENPYAGAFGRGFATGFDFYDE